MAICILQHYLPWHLDGAEEVLVLFLSEPLIQCDLEHVLHHLSHHWSQHSDQRNQTSAHQREQKMLNSLHKHMTMSNLPLTADFWPMPPSVSPVHSLLLTPSFVIVRVISWLHKEVSPPGCRDDSVCLLEMFCMPLAIPQRYFAPPFYRLSPWPGLSSLCVCIRLHARRLCLSWGLKNTVIKPAINNSTRQGVKLTDGI